jgi:hypothetical protein
MMYLFKHEWHKDELLRHTGHMDQLAGIRLFEALDGKSRGCRILDVWTGTGLRFQVNADRALDISACDFKGMSLAWRSPAGDVHPAYYEPQGLGWLRSFTGGLLTTCGLDQFGLPSKEPGGGFGLHGRISNLPASQLNYRTAWVGDEYRLEISAEVRQAALFGENLLLRRHITTALGSNRIHIEDSVTNEGFQPAPHMLLYHFNLGFPLVQAGTRLHLKALETRARDEIARGGLDAWDRCQAPTPGYQEQVFIHRPVAGEDGLVNVELGNPESGLGLRWTYPLAHLPTLMEWKMMGEGAYVVGVEPANCDGLAGREAMDAAGQTPILAPGENRAYHLALEILPPA